VLAGYTVLTPEGGETTGTLSTPHGLEGFAFTNGTETYVFACPSGKYASFEISYLGYNAANWATSSRNRFHTAAGLAAAGNGSQLQ